MLLISIIVLTVILSSTILRLSFFRLYYSFKDIGTSIIYSFCEILNIESGIKPSVLIFPKLNNSGTSHPGLLPPGNVEVPNYFDKFKLFFYKFFNIENLGGYLKSSTFYLLITIQLLMMIMLLIVGFFVIKKLKEKPIIVDPEKETRTYKQFIRFQDNLYIPFKEKIFSFLDFILNNKYIKAYLITWFIISFNLLTVINEFLAYYIYLIGSLKIASTINFQLYKLFFDLGIYFKNIPIFVHIIFAYLIFNYFRKEIGYRKLNINENRNKGFINEMPVISMVYGPMGTNKTTIITDMALSKSEMFKNKALDFILDIKKKYPDFNFNYFDNLVIKAIDERRIFNCLSVAPEVFKIVNDNIEKLNFDNELKFNNGLNYKAIISDLIDYVKLMLIYISSSNLIFSNYAIRSDNSFYSLGNFPINQTEYFKLKSYEKNEDDIFSHVLDFDMLRLGKRISENSHSFDFGIFVITEIGKERGNQLTQQGVKKDDESVNQKNDHFNNFVKLCRHTATICNYPFVSFLCDDQRPESVNADLRDLMYLYKIKKSKKKKLAIPFYGFEKTVSESILYKFDNFNLDRIYRRSDTTLRYHLLKKFIYFVYKRFLYYQNTFGYQVMNLLTEEGTSTKDSKEIVGNFEYYLAYKKIYANRFSTDAYSEYFNEMKKESNKGIEDYITYGEVKASTSELANQHSFLINEIENYKMKKETKKDENNENIR